jgi:predicted MFS family arabinose efflux permease
LLCYRHVSFVEQLTRRSEVTAWRTLSNRASYALAAGVIGIGLFASTTPSPLYQTYSVLWHFSSLTVTLIYATYALGVLTTLLLAGGVSDDVGRRPVLLVSLAGLTGAGIVFLFADSAGWLFAARGLQGLATGGALSAAAASLLDFHPRRDPAGVALTNATASAAGLGLGILVSSVVVQIGWHPLSMPYVVLVSLTAIAFVGALLMPEPIEDRKHFHLTVERPHVPAEVRSAFVLTALAVLSAWSIGALFFSLGPELAAHLFDTQNAIVIGAGIVALTGSAVAAQLATRKTQPWIAAAAGSIALAAGMMLIVVASATDSRLTYIAGTIVGGLGFGAAFFGALRGLVPKIPVQHRAEVMASVYLVGYSSLSIPAILAGVVVTFISLQSTFEIFGTAVAVIGVAVAVEAWRTRPRAARQIRVAADSPAADLRAAA